VKSGTFTRAIARRPAMSLGEGQTVAGLGSPDMELAARQHAAYCEALSSCGVDVILLGAVERYPDSTFVEDVAVIAGSHAVITRPGHPSRLGEIELIEPALTRLLTVDRNDPDLARVLRVDWIEPPGRIDGGDVLEIDDRILVGLSERTDADGARQLCTLFEQDGFRCGTVPIARSLHLKSDVSYLGNGILLANTTLAGLDEFSGLDVITVAPGEEYCANSIEVNGQILFPSGFPVTLEKLKKRGLEIIELDMSEFQKMDGGLSCLSLRMNP
jgi:dimethylargininase